MWLLRSCGRFPTIFEWRVAAGQREGPSPATKNERIPDGDKTFLTMKCFRARLLGPEGVQIWAVWLGF